MLKAFSLLRWLLIRRHDRRQVKMRQNYLILFNDVSYSSIFGFFIYLFIFFIDDVNRLVTFNNYSNT